MPPNVAIGIQVSGEERAHPEAWTRRRTSRRHTRCTAPPCRTHEQAARARRAALNADIRAWIATWSDDPHPFVWTKTADQILDSIARYGT